MTDSERERRFRRVTEIDCATDTVWATVTTQPGINRELSPYLRMTMPRTFRGRSIADVEPGTRIGKSWLLLFGILPFGVDDITIAEITPGRMFREVSRMTGMRTWIHHRTLEPAGQATIVTDEITFASRLPVQGLGALMAAILSAFFAHRHRRLRRVVAR
ncbi:hypothetical protein QWI29_07760 [Mycolicibacterium neoaurum]|uniref:hypothetical protein n=1 Tax=Mycolicibacterium neoaurum TaxID=1795 RepID=UPI002670D1AF|nr:hypothetical protein [Mycolicibacterium neoaurum]MDO3399921.1 hypothetical protein [Mycolicibacterium neoaurum]